MSDNHAWQLFPNFSATIRAGEATIILTLVFDVDDERIHCSRFSVTTTNTGMLPTGSIISKR
jgi:hypothetical protein